jgi:structural maintenance of chromosome 3 (chondroitin sulfate proteoglycan 6)
VQELGSLPSAQLETYKNSSIKQLYKHLHECNEKLKKYSHVNKKALDQYVNFSEQRAELLQRKKELDEGAESIQKLITNLDRQKDEVIIRTFRGVSEHFSQVFKELVPNGYGRMVLRTTADGKGGKDGTGGLSQDDVDETQPSEQTQDREPLHVSDFVGIQIQVSFTGQGDRYLMQQLSGT